MKVKCLKTCVKTVLLINYCTVVVNLEIKERRRGRERKVEGEI